MTQYYLHWILGIVFWLCLLIASGLLLTRVKGPSSGIIVVGAAIALLCKVVATSWVVVQPPWERDSSEWNILLALDYGSDLGEGLFVFGFVMVVLAFRRSPNLRPK